MRDRETADGGTAAGEGPEGGDALAGETAEPERLAPAPDPVLLGTDRVVVRFASGTEAPGAARVHLRLMPNPKIEAAAHFTRLLTELNIPTTFTPDLGIPTHIRTEINALIALAQNGPDPWDGPTSIAKIRNGFVHPEARDRAATADVIARVGAMLLSQWYVELALLRLFGYHGSYSNRLSADRWVGQVAPTLP